MFTLCYPITLHKIHSPYLFKYCISCFTANVICIHLIIIISLKKLLFVNSSSTVASRDYTFVDDVVIGVILAMNHQPNQCGETYNIGSGAEPVSMKKAFLLLKQEMEKPAEMVCIG